MRSVCTFKGGTIIKLLSDKNRKNNNHAGIFIQTTRVVEIRSITLVILIEAALRLLVRRPKLQADAFIGGHCAY